MLRDWNMQQVTDGQLYTSKDLVKIGCNDCKGCSECCRTVGDSISLDPYDFYQLTKGLKVPASALLGEYVSLGVTDGLVLPSIRMKDRGMGAEACGFLNPEGRCEIHAFRPGFCRMFPLGRIYEEDGFRYFIQIHECKSKAPRTKVKIKSWLGIENLPQYENFILDWHKLLVSFRDRYGTGDFTDEVWKAINMAILQSFFLTDYDISEDFYSQYQGRKETFYSNFASVL